MTKKELSKKLLLENGSNKELILNEIDRMIIMSEEEHDNINDVIGYFYYIKSFIQKTF